MQAVRRMESQAKMNKDRRKGPKDQGVLSEDDSTVIARLESGYQVKFCLVKQWGFIWPLRFDVVRVLLKHMASCGPLNRNPCLCVCVFALVLLFSCPDCLKKQPLAKNSREGKNILIVPSSLDPWSLEGFTATKARR